MRTYKLKLITLLLMESDTKRSLPSVKSAVRKIDILLKIFSQYVNRTISIHTIIIEIWNYTSFRCTDRRKSQPFYFELLLVFITINYNNNFVTKLKSERILHLPICISYVEIFETIFIQNFMLQPLTQYIAKIKIT